MEGWKKALMYAGGATGVAAVLYYLLREEPEGLSGEGGAAASKEAGKKDILQAEDVTKDQVILILKQMIDSQERMKAHMKELTVKLIEKDMDFEETYEQVRSVQPDDPLERSGLSMNDFDQLLNKHQADPQVMEGITRIMGMADPGNKPAGKLKDVSEAQVIEVHAFMLMELKGLLALFSGIKSTRNWDMKTVTLASQAIVGAKVEKKYNLNSEEIERAVMKHHNTLATNQEFEQINIKMQQTMTSLMGTAGPGGP